MSHAQERPPAIKVERLYPARQIAQAAARSTLSTSEIVFLLGSITVGIGGLLVATGKR